jgi:hypothetical protein
MRIILTAVRYALGHGCGSVGRGELPLAVVASYVPPSAAHNSATAEVSALL